MTVPRIHHPHRPPLTRPIPPAHQPVHKFGGLERFRKRAEPAMRWNIGLSSAPNWLERATLSWPRCLRRFLATKVRRTGTCRGDLREDAALLLHTSNTTSHTGTSTLHRQAHSSASSKNFKFFRTSRLVARGELRSLGLGLPLPLTLTKEPISNNQSSLGHGKELT